MLGSKKAEKTLNWIEIQRGSFQKNLEFFQKLDPNRAVAPVLKGNAYGHGLALIAPWMDELKVPFLIVDSIFEAYQLRKYGAKTPILILSAVLPEQIQRRRHSFSFALSNFESIDAFAKTKDPVHLEVNTGMNRTGFSLKDLPEALREIRKNNLELEGLFTHLLDAENSDQIYNEKQVKVFQEAIQIVHQAGFKPRWIHVSASDSAAKIILPELNLMRLGLGFYGVSSDKKAAPALKVFSRIVQIHELKPGEVLGYGASYIAQKPIRVGVLPFGYFEGVPRSLSNRGPFLGRICMNHSFVEISADAKVGDPYEIYPNIQESARLAETIPYELLVRLNADIRRVEL